MFDLKKKKILITGAGGLLGREFSISILKSGGTCFALDLNKKKLKELIKIIPNKLKKKITPVNIDITDREKLFKFYKELSKKKIFIDTIINNAANNPGITKIKKNVISEWENDIKLNLTAVKNLIEIFSVSMKKMKNGNIINIGSDLSLIAPDQRLYSHLENFQKPVSYSVSKHGILGITKYYASLLAKFNIRVNCICPGGVKLSQDQRFLNKINKLIPLGRMAQKNEFNGAIVFLCSDESRYMTGQNLIIDGGRTII